MDGKKMLDLFKNIDDELIEGSEKYKKNNTDGLESAEKTDTKSSMTKVSVSGAKRFIPYIAAFAIALSFVLVIAATAVFLIEDDKEGANILGTQKSDDNDNKGKDISGKENPENKDNEGNKDSEGSEGKEKYWFEKLGKSQYEAMLDLMSMKRAFPEFDEKESRKRENDLSEQEKMAQKNTARYIGYKKLTKQQTAALEEVRSDIRYKNRLWSSDWMPYKEFLALGEIEPIQKRLTLDDAKKIIEETDSFDEVVEMFARRQIVPDFEYDYRGAVKQEYWLDDEGSRVILLWGHNCDEMKRNIISDIPIVEREYVFYMEKEKWAESGWVTCKKDVLAIYDPQLRKLSSEELAQCLKYDWKAESKDYKEKDKDNWEKRKKLEEERSGLTKEELSLQIDTHPYIGYKKLTKEQIYELGEIENEELLFDTATKLIRKRIEVIEGGALEHRLTVEKMKEIIASTSEQEPFEGNEEADTKLWKIKDILIEEQYFPDRSQSYKSGENKLITQYIYWIDDSYTKYISITNRITYEEIKDDKPQVIEVLYQK